MMLSNVSHVCFFNAAQTCLYNNKDNLLCILTEAQSKLWKTSL